MNIILACINKILLFSLIYCFYRSTIFFRKPCFNFYKNIFIFFFCYNIYFTIVSIIIPSYYFNTYFFKILTSNLFSYTSYFYIMKNIITSIYNNIYFPDICTLIKLSNSISVNFKINSLAVILVLFNISSNDASFLLFKTL